MKLIARYLICFIPVLAAFAVALPAQPVCKTEHYSTEDGLSHDIITCMYKDREGFMWFGTWNGINRFDGRSFVTYASAPDDQSYLKNNRIDQITEDESHYLWVKAYDGQIYRFDKHSEQFVSLSVLLRLPYKNKYTFKRILSAGHGRVWIETDNEGLVLVLQPQADSSAYVTYDVHQPPQFRLPHNHIHFFKEDKKGCIWIGTQQGLACLVKNKKGYYITASMTLPAGADITAIASNAAADTFYFGTADGRIAVLNTKGKTFRYCSLSKAGVHSLYMNRAQTLLYATTAAGELLTVNRNDNTVKRVLYLPDNSLYSIYEDKTSYLWLEPEREGVVRYEPGTGNYKIYRQQNNARYNYSGDHFTVFEDVTGLVWVNLKGGGFGYYNKAADVVDYFYNQPNTPDRRFSNIVNTLYYDKDGLLWLRTDERGMEKITFLRNAFEQQLLVNASAFRSDNEVRGICSDQHQRLWVGVKGGNLYIQQQGKSLTGVLVNMPEKGLGLVYTILEDAEGNIWLGTKADGLYKAVPEDKNASRYRLYHYTHQDGDSASISSNEIYSLLQDKAGNIWAGTFEEGLNKVVEVEGKVGFLHHAGALRNYPAGICRKIRHMATDADGRLWLATTDGLLVVDTRNAGNYSYAFYQKKQGDSYSLGNNDVQYAYRDSRGNMWLATSGGGLNLTLGQDPMTGLRFRKYSTRDGLPNNYIVSCMEDGQRNLWIATQTGLSRLDPDRKSFRNYNSRDGLPPFSFSEASVARLPDGRLAFGTIKGYVLFQPQSITDYPIQAQMAFTQLQINNRAISAGGADGILPRAVNYLDELMLKHYQNTISIDYRVPDFRSGDRQTYAYRLSGFDTGWQVQSGEHRATYTNLPPGKYVFEVKCINSELYSNTPARTIAVTILPPLWKTWWAYCVYVLLALGILLLIRRSALTVLRLRQGIILEKRLAELKLNFFTHVSHELRTPLTLILNPMEAIRKNETLTPLGSQYLEVIHRNAIRMGRYVNQLLELRKLESGMARLQLSEVELVAFARNITAYFTAQAREKQIALTVESNEQEVYAGIDAEKTETVIYNLLGNAFKYTPAGKAIRLVITRLPGGQIRIEVEDEGSGVPPAQLDRIFDLFYEGQENKAVKGTGIGLAISKEMVVLHGGEITACNNKKGGLTVRIELPAKQPGEQVVATFTPDVTGQDAVAETDERNKEQEAGEQLPLVLVVEDNADLQYFLKSQLSAAYRVEVAVNGAEGWVRAQELLPDLIISDVMMPEMDGIALLRHVKEQLATSHIPVILLTARSAVESQVEGLAYGADYYITKPFSNELLLVVIRNLIRQRKRVLESLLAGNSHLQPQPGEMVVTSRDEQFLQNIGRIVEEKMADVDFNIDTVAESINMSRTTFYRKFKGLTGIAPVEFVKELRLQRARQYLDAGNGNISEIAYAVGFNNARYFSTCFKARYEATPSEYLKQLGKSAL